MAVCGCDLWLQLVAGAACPELLPPIQESCREFPATSFSPVPVLAVVGTGGVNQQAEACMLSLAASKIRIDTEMLSCSL